MIILSFIFMFAGARILISGQDPYLAIMMFIMGAALTIINSIVNKPEVK